MRFLVTLFALFISVAAFADFSANYSLTSDYVWRGLTQTNHDPAVQGGVDYKHPIGLNIGTWLSNVSGEAATEVDLYGSYYFGFNDDLGLSLGGTYYHYTHANKIDTLEVNLVFSIHKFGLSANYTNDYFGTKSESFYFLLSRKFDLIENKKISVGASVGFTTFNDQALVGYKDYLDYRLTLTKEMKNNYFSLFFTDTTRQTASSSDIDDHAIGIIVGGTFSE